MTAKSKSFGEVFDAHTAAEFQTRDIEATMATMGETPHVTHVPVMTGGHGADAVRSFYETWFIGHWPEDTEITLVSRTVGREPAGRRADPLFHPRLRDAGDPAGHQTDRAQGDDALRGRSLASTGRQDHAIEHIYWDQATRCWCSSAYSIQRRCR